jgi:hypothetical protein
MGNGNFPDHEDEGEGADHQGNDEQAPPSRFRSDRTEHRRNQADC